MATKPLLDIESPAYLRRLVRELNAAGMVNGFYAPVATFNVRCNRARLDGDTLQVRACGDVSPAWFTPARHDFEDGNGGSIVASRRA